MFGRLRRAPAIAVLALAVLAPLASCSPGSAHSGEPPLGPVRVVRSTVNLVLPLDAYHYTNAQYITFLRAKWQLEHRCMERFGATVNPVPAPAELVVGVTFPDFDHENVLRYGLLDAQSAKTRGYDPPSQPTPRPSDDTTNLGQRELFLLFGKTRAEFASVAQVPVGVDGRPLPEDGCTGESNRLLTNGRPNFDWTLGERLAGDAHHRAENDSRTQAAIRAWSSCMKRSGYDYTSIWQANDRQWPEPPTPAETSTAETDVACKLDSNLVGVWFAVETAYQEWAIEDHAGELAGVRKYIDTVLANATNVLSGR